MTKAHKPTRTVTPMTVTQLQSHCTPLPGLVSAKSCLLLHHTGTLQSKGSSNSAHCSLPPWGPLPGVFCVLFFFSLPFLGLLFTFMASSEKSLPHMPSRLAQIITSPDTLSFRNSLLRLLAVSRTRREACLLRAVSPAAT